MAEHLPHDAICVFNELGPARTFSELTIQDRAIRGQPLKFLQPFLSLWRFETLRNPALGSEVILRGFGAIGVLDSYHNIQGVIALRSHIHMTDPLEMLCQFGQIYIPPYLSRRDEKALSRHAFASGASTWSVQGPTSLTYLTHELATTLIAKRIRFVPVRLHVGRADDINAVLSAEIDNITLDEEFAEVPELTAQAVNAARKQGRLVIAWGTTAARAVESHVAEGDYLAAGSSWTSLSITKPDKLRLVDGLISSIQPWPTTVLAAQVAFAGPELLAAVSRYREFLRAGELGDLVLAWKENL